MMPPMASRQGAVARALRTAADDEARIRTEIFRARRGAGLSHDEVGRACGLSRTQVARSEAGTRPTTIAEYAAIGAAVGLDVRGRAYPAGDPIRDIGQQRLLTRLSRRLHASLRLRTEVGLPIAGDLRAWDATIEGRSWRVAIDAETVLDDIQALERRLSLKQRDSGEAHMILVVADTPRNRRSLAAAPAAFAGFSRDARATLRALGSGVDPATNAVILL
jgi:transcriptional regulator with XRE-family HTH domain